CPGVYRSVIKSSINNIDRSSNNQHYDPSALPAFKKHYSFHALKAVFFDRHQTVFWFIWCRGKISIPEDT
ncbi:hypothetical protein, partial [Enterobacter hormaechei]|uniref:hypothetical protein n=1 Tax=Enterobacter hormaechei TaxID=158836 RepID=UPI001D02D1E9